MVRINRVILSFALSLISGLAHARMITIANETKNSVQVSVSCNDGKKGREYHRMNVLGNKTAQWDTPYDHIDSVIAHQACKNGILRGDWDKKPISTSKFTIKIDGNALTVSGK